MKYLRTYENVINDFSKKEKEFNNEKMKINYLLEEFINFNRKNYTGIDSYVEKIRVKRFEISSKGKMIIVTYCDFYDKTDLHADHLYLTDDDYDEFIKFAEDPDLYMNAKKYNL